MAHSIWRPLRSCAERSDTASSLLHRRRFPTKPYTGHNQNTLSGSPPPTNQQHRVGPLHKGCARGGYEAFPDLIVQSHPRICQTHPIQCQNSDAPALQAAVRAAFWEATPFFGRVRCMRVEEEGLAVHVSANTVCCTVPKGKQGPWSIRTALL